MEHDARVGCVTGFISKWIELINTVMFLVSVVSVVSIGVCVGCVTVFVHSIDLSDLTKTRSKCGQPHENKRGVMAS